MCYRAAYCLPEYGKHMMRILRNPAMKNTAPAVGTPKGSDTARVVMSTLLMLPVAAAASEPMGGGGGGPPLLLPPAEGSDGTSPAAEACRRGGMRVSQAR